MRDDRKDLLERGVPTQKRVEDAQHNPAQDLETYMGMAAHAEFVRSDFSVFAHIHPAGSVPMASLMLAQRDVGLPMDHGSIHSTDAEVSFPYGFPQLAPIVCLYR